MRHRCSEKHKLSVSVSRLASVTNPRRYGVLPPTNDRARPHPDALHPSASHIPAYSGLGNNLICKHVWVFAYCRQGFSPGQHLPIGRPSRIDKEGFHSQNPRLSPGSVRVPLCSEDIGMASQPLFISLYIPLCWLLCVSHEYKPRVTGFIWASHEWNMGERNKLYLVCITPPPPPPHAPPPPHVGITWVLLFTLRQLFAFHSCFVGAYCQ